MARAGDRSATVRPGAWPRLLIVEDEPGILDFLRRGLQGEGFTVETEADGLAGERRALDESFDVLVLDLMLPGRGGLEILSSLQQSKPLLPVILLTARGEIEDRVAGLDAGAVDYLVKPFALSELAARVRAQLRLAGRSPAASTLRGADIELDLLTRQVRRRGQRVHLSSTELELLAYLLRHRGRVLTRAEILANVWDHEHDSNTNVVDVYVGYLRRKLRQPDSPAPISTIRSVGYRLDE